MSRRLVLAKSAYQAVVSDCLRHSDTEIGGVLPGRPVGGEFVVPFSISAGPRAIKSAVRFSPDSRWQQTILDYLHARFGTDYIGDWHRHPGLFDQPSRHDLRTARHIVTDPIWNKAEALFPIAVIDDGTVRLRAYLIRRETLQFEEIPLEVVPDSDSRMIAVLTGMDADTMKETIHADTAILDSRRLQGRHPARRLLRRLAAGLRHLSRI